MTAGPLRLRGGRVVDGAGVDEVLDVVVEGGVVVAIGPEAAEGGSGPVIDCSGRLVMPGVVDVHSHADAAVFDEHTQLALLSQGVSTVVVGQDGVSFAPGDGSYATEYFGGLNGPHPTYRGGGIGALLATYDQSVPVNVATLVPAGTVRYEVMGRTGRPPTAAELEAMVALVAEGLAEGAVGLSSGLDYVPGLFASASELGALATPLADSGGVYVTHMRGGYEANVRSGLAEVVEIVRAAGGVPAHVSHFHAPPELALLSLDEVAADGCDLTFDSYPYRASMSLLSMPLLPPELLVLSPGEVVAVLADPARRDGIVAELDTQVTSYASLGSGWADRMTLAHTACPAFAWAEGLTVAEAARRHGTSVAQLCVSVLAESRLQATAVMPWPPGRTVDDLAGLIGDPRHMVGSDGIYVGDHPHPRGWGAVARVLSRHVQQRGDLSWPEASWRLSAHPARRFGLGARGTLAPGSVADLVILDPATLTDVATYAHPRQPAVGVTDVYVAGVAVLTDGRLTGRTPGHGIRRSPPTPYAPARHGAPRP